MKTSIVEKKSVNRFIVKSFDEQGEPIFPSFIVKNITNPFYIKNIGNVNHVLKYIEIDCWSPIIPSTEQFLWEYMVFKKKNYIKLSVQFLGPVGDIISEMEIFGNIKEVKQSNKTLNYDSTEPLITKIVVETTDIKLLY